MQCGAKTRSGEPCKAPPVRGRERCRMHGGSTPTGFGLPQTKTGRWSKDLPTRLAARYEAALADGKLLELRNELAVIDARLGELLGALESGEAGAVWKDLTKARAEFNDPAKRMDALRTMLDLIERGAEEWQRWEDVFRTIERRARIAESERRRLVEAQQMVSAEQVNVLVAALIATVRQHVKEPAALRGISTDLSRLLHAGAPVAEA